MFMPGVYVTLTRTGYMECVVPENILQSIKVEVDKIIESDFTLTKKHNYDLAGAIEKEYKLQASVPVVESFVSMIANNYWSELDSPYKDSKHIIPKGKDKSSDLWINFQKKGEYNPLHKHRGLLSFVIWYQVPYDIEEERKLPLHQNLGDCSAGEFSFAYPDPYVVGGVSTHRIVVDKSKQGSMIIFPASLRHQVYPFFTSDNYRISISGNLIPVQE
jgi:hypothetical protein